MQSFEKCLPSLPFGSRFWFAGSASRHSFVCSVDQYQWWHSRDSYEEELFCPRVSSWGMFFLILTILLLLGSILPKNDELWSIIAISNLFLITIMISFGAVILQEYVDEFLILFGFEMRLHLYLHFAWRASYILLKDENRANFFDTESKSSSLEHLQIVFCVVE